VNEKFILDKRLASISSYISSELGPFALNQYEEAQDLIGAGILRIINEGDRTGSFRGQNARGGSQWDVQQLTVDALEADGTSIQEASAARVYNTGGAGTFNVAPKIDPGNGVVNDPSSKVAGSEENGAHSMNDDTQAAFILGYYQSTNPRVIERGQIEVDDGQDRTPFDVYSHQNLGTLQAQTSVSYEYLTDDDAFDINATATQDARTDFYPFGVNFDTAGRLPDLDTQVV
jgi:hypothetical protein